MPSSGTVFVQIPLANRVMTAHACSSIAAPRDGKRRSGLVFIFVKCHLECVMAKLSVSLTVN